MCWAPGSVVWWPRSLPIRTGSRRWGDSVCPVRREPWAAGPAERAVAAARTALPAPEAVVARQVLADDLGLLAELDAQIAAAEAKITKLLRDTRFAVVLTVPGWGHDPGRQQRRRGRRTHRWPGASQIYCASGLSPTQYESAGKRRDGSNRLRPGPGRGSGTITTIDASDVIAVNRLAR
jgi:hypothetical protein